MSIQSTLPGSRIAARFRGSHSESKRLYTAQVRNAFNASRLRMGWRKNSKQKKGAECGAFNCIKPLREFSDQAADRLFSVTKEHSRVVFVKQWVLNTGKTGGH